MKINRHRNEDLESGQATLEWVLIVGAIVLLATAVIVAVDGLVGDQVQIVDEYDNPVENDGNTD